jgi:hypothetical protein
MHKKSIISFCFLIVFLNFVQVLKAQENPFFNYQGKLIIIGGGDIPDSLFTFFANYCGGKDQSIVYIPTKFISMVLIKYCILTNLFFQFFKNIFGITLTKAFLNIQI